MGESSNGLFAGDFIQEDVFVFGGAKHFIHEIDLFLTKALIKGSALFLSGKMNRLVLAGHL